MQKRTLAVIGQGYVGLPLSMRAAEVGFSVVGVETDAARVDRLAAGDSYVEDVPSPALRAALDAGRYRPTTSYDDATGFDVAVITVPTPLREGAPDLSHIEDAGRALAPLLQPGATVVLESTTYPGTTQDLLQPLLEKGSGLLAGTDFFLGYSPERIDPGNPVYQLVNTPKVVSGIDAASLQRVQGFFDEIVDVTVAVSSPREAELAKLLENTFRHVNIALVNELAVFAHEMGIDIWEVIDAAATKPFGYMRFTPGPGVGGHCLPIDPSYLSWQVKRALGHSFRFVELANDVNDHMPDYVVQRLMLTLNEHEKSVKGARLLLLGLAYKKNTGDARESPAARIAELLVGLGAVVTAADPHVSAGQVPTGVSRVELTAEAVRDTDAVLLLADHDAFDLSLLEGAVVLDTRHVLKPHPGVQYL
jgi:UDP-N-acetyl-D-glucosamine dehydrogenase